MLEMLFILIAITLYIHIYLLFWFSSQYHSLILSQEKTCPSATFWSKCQRGPWKKYSNKAEAAVWWTVHLKDGGNGKLTCLLLGVFLYAIIVLIGRDYIGMHFTSRLRIWQWLGTIRSTLKSILITMKMLVLGWIWQSQFSQRVTGQVINLLILTFPKRW